MTTTTSVSSQSAEVGGRFDLLLDRLRSKASSLRPFPELSRSMRQTLMDRRFALDSAEKAILQKCLDRFQERIPVRTAAGMAERLETVGRKIGLKFMGAPVHGCYYLSTEMFYVEINIDAAGNVNEAKIHHIVAPGADGSSSASAASAASKHPTTQNCPEIIECLSRGDFGEFVAHLEGLVAVYNLGAAASALDKSRAWQALSCAEQDLQRVFNSYRSWYPTTPSLVHATRVGLLHPRTGGLPLKLRYFLPPADLVLSGEAVAPADLTEAVLLQRDLGLTVTLTTEKSESRGCLMPTKSLVTNLDTNGIPILGDEMVAGKGNCVSLPARFLLRMDAPLVVSLEKCREIEKMTGFQFADDALKEESSIGASTPLMQAIVKNKSRGMSDGANNRGLFVTLPDQQHCYFLTDIPGSYGVRISSIPFSHPGNVPVIIDILRQQANFNAIVESCVRMNSLQDLDKSIMFELSYSDLKHVSVTFEHPSEECIATVEMDLGNVDAGPKCKVFASSETSVCPEDTLNAVMKRSLSVPVAMRAIVRHNQGRRGGDEAFVPNGNGLAPPTAMNGNNGGLTTAHLQRLQNGGRAVKTEEPDKGGGGGGGGVEVKTEPMEFEFSGRNTLTTNTASLNEYGPRDTALNPEAAKPNLKSTAKIASSTSSSAPSSTSKLSSVRRDPIKQEFQLTKMNKDTSSNAAMIGPQADIKPSVSIIPLAGHDLLSAANASTVTAAPTGSSSSSAAAKKSVMSTGGGGGGGGGSSAGFEIIPLLGEDKQPLSASSGSSSRDIIKRSLSEEDSRTSKKPKKRKHESSSRMSGSGGEKKSFLSSSTSSSPDKFRKGGGSASSSPDKLTSAVIDRLAQSSADTGIEILPASGPNVVAGKGGSDSRDKSGSGRSGDSGGSGNTSGIKLTIKTPSKYSSSSSSSSASKSRSSSSFSSSPHSGSKSSSSYSDGRSKHSSSSTKYSSPSSSHRHSQSVKEKSSGGGSGGTTSKFSSPSSSSSSSDRDKKKSGPDAGSRYAPSSSSHKEKEKQRSEEEVKKLFGGKLNKTFQIPKLSKGSSPSQKTPTTSPKYSSISPKQQQQQQPSSSYAPSTGASPNYIGGGSATPPALSSPKHPYSAPNSVPGVTRSSPLQGTSPKTSSRTTPSQSPTYIGGGGGGGGGGRQQGFSAPGLPLSRPPASGGQDEGVGPN